MTYSNDFRHCVNKFSKLLIIWHQAINGNKFRFTISQAGMTCTTMFRRNTCENLYAFVWKQMMVPTPNITNTRITSKQVQPVCYQLSLCKMYHVRNTWKLRHKAINLCFLSTQDHGWPTFKPGSQCTDEPTCMASTRFCEFGSDILGQQLFTSVTRSHFRIVTSNGITTANCSWPWSSLK